MFTAFSKIVAGVGASVVILDRTLSHTLSLYPFLVLSRIIAFSGDMPFVIFLDFKNALVALTPFY